MTPKTLNDVPESTFRQLLDYSAAATSRLRAGRHDFRIPLIVADEWVRNGHCILSTNGLARQFDSTRRTMCFAIARCIEAGCIRKVGRTDDGRAIYAPCLEIGDEWRAAKEARANGQH
jgi:hypothetical protein